MDWIKLIIVVGLSLFEALAVFLGIIQIPKRKKADLIVKKEFVSSSLPAIIKVAEGASKDGLEKKELVVSWALSALEKHFGVLCDSDKITITKYISDSVEDILSTPQKKG